MSAILILRSRIAPAELRRLLDEGFKDMVKYVVDIEQGVLAAGGGLHADAEGVLLEAGSRPQDLWGANYHPGRGPQGCVEFTSLINIRPAQGNPGMEVRDPAVRERVRAITFELLGQGEAL
jgi:hypothetical protein